MRSAKVKAGFDEWWPSLTWQVRCACYNATQLLEGVDNSTSDSARRRLYGKFYDEEEEEEEDGYGDGYHRELRRKRVSGVADFSSLIRA